MAEDFIPHESPLHARDQHGRKVSGFNSSDVSAVEMQVVSGKQEILVHKEINEPNVITWKERVKEKLLQVLPVLLSVDVRDLKEKGVGHPLALFYATMYATLLIYFVISGTMTGMGKRFLALTPSADGAAVCESIPVAVTGSFEADTFGCWNTQRQFNYNSSVYKLSMTGTTVTADQYAVVMQRFSHGLQQLGNRVATSDIVSSLIAWSVFRMKDEETKVAFTTTAQLQLIFSTVIITTPAFSSSMGICNSFVISSAYSPDTNIITMPRPAAHRTLRLSKHFWTGILKAQHRY